MAAPTNWRVFDDFKEQVGLGKHVLGTDTCKMLLISSTAASPSLSADDVLADLAGEVATATGYARATLTSATWTQSGSTTTLDFADATFTANSTGGGFNCKYAVIYNDTQTSPADPLIAYSNLDNSTGIVSISAGNTLTVNVTNVFKVTGATT